MNTGQAADHLAQALEGLGIEIARSESSQSESVYLTLDKDDATMTVRISDHELPPTYGMVNGWADVELWVNERRPSAAFWAKAVETIARAWDGAPGWEPTPAIVDALAWYERWLAIMECERKRLEACWEENRHDDERRVENQRLLDADGSGHLTGQSRKRRLRKLREQMEEPA